MTADHSIVAMVQSSGGVVQSVLVILIILSIFSWAITIAKFLQFSKARKISNRFAELFWESRNFTKIEESFDELAGSPLAQVFHRGYEELSTILEDEKGSNADAKPSSDAAKLSMLESALERSQYQESLKLERGLTFLATVASAAPFIGLFGTVWGIMDAFNGLSTSSNNTLQAVAPGISEALIATAIGLAAAIPASIAYNYCAVAVKNFRENMHKFSGEFLSIAERYFVK